MTPTNQQLGDLDDAIVEAVTEEPKDLSSLTAAIKSRNLSIMRCRLFRTKTKQYELLVRRILHLRMCERIKWDKNTLTWSAATCP